MEYTKPQVVVLASAADAIQSGKKDSTIHQEVTLQPTMTAAYEADE